jgi:hypothetical protein
MAISSTIYPVFEFERKHKKAKRKRRIAVVGGGVLWHPTTVDYSSRVKLDSGTIEGLLCLNFKIVMLSALPKRPDYTTITNNYIGRVIYDGGSLEAKTCLDNEIKELQA